MVMVMHPFMISDTTYDDASSTHTSPMRNSNNNVLICKILGLHAGWFNRGRSKLIFFCQLNFCLIDPKFFGQEPQLKMKSHPKTYKADLLGESLVVVQLHTFSKVNDENLVRTTVFSVINLFSDQSSPTPDIYLEGHLMRTCDQWFRQTDEHWLDEVAAGVYDVLRQEDVRETQTMSI